MMVLSTTLKKNILTLLEWESTARPHYPKIEYPVRIGTMRSISAIIALQIIAAVHVAAFGTKVPSTRYPRRIEPLHAVNGVWNTGNDFGKGKFRFYEGQTIQLSLLYNVVESLIFHMCHSLSFCVLRGA